ncbi:MAG: YdiU family protein [Bacteriovoracaceae bacterium]|jgi:serine/tyrosine/threonine adenylyltransferase|nr:YdiU family protein [Bacteriovoracaceae bacterium]
MINFFNSYSKLPERFFERVSPAKFKNPKLISFNYKLAAELKIDVEGVSEKELALIFSGQKILSGSEPISTAYAAHQFGHFVPQLGDGRAHLLGEVNGFDVQLKGSGQTPFSRNGDGRSGLGPVIREYLVSEAMYHLAVPTTRALSAVTTGENVFRQNVEPGAVFTRIAPSHIRVGTFQYFACHNDFEGLKELLAYSINRHYPNLEAIESLPLRVISFIQSVGDAQAKLISKWMALGFIHGVMNTDNYSVGGFTIDYGPCAFMDEYKEHKVFSSIDRHGRYSYKNQIHIGQWNLLRLADCLLPLIDENKDVAISKVEKIIPTIIEKFDNEYLKSMGSKFGILNIIDSDKTLVNDFLSYIEEEELDFTLAFRNLIDLFNGKTCFYPNISKLESFIQKWRNRVTDVSSLNTINPLLIPRNHQIERAIVQANNGDYKIFNDLKKALQAPYSENSQYSKYVIPPKLDERITETFCGT